MFKKLARTKVFRDPIYGYVEVEYQIILDLIDSKEVQRLRSCLLYTSPSPRDTR